MTIKELRRELRRVPKEMDGFKFRIEVFHGHGNKSRIIGEFDPSFLFLKEETDDSLAIEKTVLSQIWLPESITVTENKKP